MQLFTMIPSLQAEKLQSLGYTCVAIVAQPHKPPIVVGAPEGVFFFQNRTKITEDFDDYIVKEGSKLHCFKLSMFALLLTSIIDSDQGGPYKDIPIEHFFYFELPPTGLQPNTSITLPKNAKVKMMIIHSTF